MSRAHRSPGDLAEPHSIDRHPSPNGPRIRCIYGGVNRTPHKCLSIVRIASRNRDLDVKQGKTANVASSPDADPIRAQDLTRYVIRDADIQRHLAASPCGIEPIVQFVEGALPPL